MVAYTEYDFKFAKTILKEHYPQCFLELEDCISQLQPPLGRNVTPTPARVLEDIFVEKGWKNQQPVTPRSNSLKFDLAKDKVAAEIQLADPSDCYNDYLKFLLAYNLESIDVAIEIVYDNSVRGNNIPKISKVIRDLDIYRRVLPSPIWVIGLKES